jgi:hypothetical protein
MLIQWLETASKKTITDSLISPYIAVNSIVI